MTIVNATQREWLVTALLGVVTSAILAMTPWSLDQGSPERLIYLIAICLTAYWLEKRVISLGPAGTFSPAPMLFYLMGLIHGPWGLLILSVILPRTGKRLVSRVFNVCQTVIAGAASALVFHIILERLPYPIFDFVLASVMSMAVFITLNLCLVMLVKALARHGSIRTLWALYYIPILPIYLDNLIHGALCAMVCYYLGWPGILQAVVVALLKSRAQQRLAQAELGKTLSAEALIQVVDARDRYTKDHSERVAAYAQAIATHLDLPIATIAEVELAARLHDIGKIALPDTILLKSGPLTDAEYRCVREHPLKSQQIIGANPQLKAIAAITAQHHERYDGQGYPFGLVGEQTMLEARIIACADAFDAMTTNRPYHRALSIDEAISELKRHSGTQFDPLVVEAMLKHLGYGRGFDQICELPGAADSDL